MSLNHDVRDVVAVLLAERKHGLELRSIGSATTGTVVNEDLEDGQPRFLAPVPADALLSGQIVGVASACLYVG
jgi:hypothetical protein